MNYKKIDLLPFLSYPWIIIEQMFWLVFFLTVICTSRTFMSSFKSFGFSRPDSGSISKMTETGSDPWEENFN